MATGRQRGTRRHKDTTAVRRNQMEPANTARAYPTQRESFVSPLEVAKETASGGGTHFCFGCCLVVIDWNDGEGGDEFLLVVLAHLNFSNLLVAR